MSLLHHFFFFFQAEDGIRDVAVTGVQTCALPISFGDAINAEVQSALFLTNNFRGFSLNLAGINDKSFLTLPVEATPATTVTLRNLPQARFGSVEQAPWHKIPLYFSLDSFVGAVHRADSVPPTPSYTPIDTPLSVPREEIGRAHV